MIRRPHRLSAGVNNNRSRPPCCFDNHAGAAARNSLTTAQAYKLLPDRIRHIDCSAQDGHTRIVRTCNHTEARAFYDRHHLACPHAEMFDIAGFDVDAHFDSRTAGWLRREVVEFCADDQPGFDFRPVDDSLLLDYDEEVGRWRLVRSAGPLG